MLNEIKTELESEIEKSETTSDSGLRKALKIVEKYLEEGENKEIK